MTSAVSADRRTARARNATITVFTVNGVTFASWTARLPDVKARLDLTPGRLSLLLFALSVGAVVGLPLAGRIAHRLGSAATVRTGAVVALPGMVLAAVAVQAHGSVAVVAPGLFLLGLGTGVWDVAQNLEGSIVERSLGRAIMPWFHAGFSLGTVFGALVGAAATYFRVPIAVHIPIVVLASLATIAWSTAHFVPAFDDPTGPTAPGGPARSAWTEPRTLLIGLTVLAAAFTEGTANDWVAVAFVDGHHVTKALGVMALAVFLLFMTLGRIVGTRVLDRHGRVPVLRVLFTAAAIGCVAVVFGYTWLAFVGAAVWGVGASLGFPVGMSAASDEPRRAALRLSVVSTIGYVAFLAGPPLLGLLGDHFGVLRSLLVVGAICAVAILLAPATRELDGAAGG